MKNDIYNMLNNCEIDLEDLDKENFDEVEMKRIKRKFRKSISKKGNKKWSIVAASLAIIVLVGISDGGREVLASISNFTITALGLEEYLGIDRDISDYATVINNSITHNGITVQLNEVILNGDELIVYTTFKSNVKLEEGDRSISAAHDIKINGKRVVTAGHGYMKQIDDYTVEDVNVLTLKDGNLTGDLEVKIVYDDMTINWEEQKTKPWVFEFIANGDELRGVTNEVVIDKEIKLDSGEVFYLDKYISNPIEQKISYSFKGKESSEYIIELRGEDNLGNGIVFVIDKIGEKEGYLELWSNIEKDGDKPIRNQNYHLSGEVTTITLTPYVRDFNGNTKEFKQVGDSFTIDINR